ncbi:MAG: hypothetical protein RQ866_08060, partial [Bacteroidales bacterium]|nr:hypothetical protein [Bacteroidales bacterium]
MMIKKTFNWRSLLPYVVAILVFYAICIAFFNPLLEGKRLKQSDIVSHKGMAKDINDHREQYEEEPYWTDGMFSGMPSYLISVYYKSNIIKELNKVFKGFLPNPAGMVFLYLLGFYILLLSLRVDKWLSIVGAIAFAFSSYFFIILEPGHNTKALAIGYMAPLFAGIILTYRGKYCLGAGMTALFLTLQIKANHPQITYYLLLLLLLYVFVVLADHIKNKMLPKFLKSTGILAVIALLAVATHAPTLLAMNEYLEVSTRGTSEIAIDKQKKTKGLDRDYATAWSYGKQESLSLLIPNIKGGSSSKAIGENESLLKAVNEPDMVQTIANTSAYFGNQPFTSGPVYIGAIVIFLFVLGMFILKGRLKWVLFAATVFSILLAWGKNMMWLTNLFLDYFPMYSKFRAVSMILVIAELCVPIVAFLGLKQIYQQPRIIFDKVKIFGREIQKIVLAFILTGGIAFLFVIAPGIITLEKENEADNMRKSFVNYYQQQMSKQGQQADMAQINEAANQFVPQYMNELENVRKKIVRNDAFRSFIYILLAAALLFFTTRRKKFNPMFLTVFLGLLIL